MAADAARFAATGREARPVLADAAGVGAAGRVHLGQPRREALLLQELLRFGVSA